MSFVDLAWLRLGVDPIESGARLVDGHEFAAGAAGERGPMLVGHCHARRVLSDIKLTVDLDDPPAVTVLQRLGLPDECVFEVPWAELDRSFEPDHLTCIWIPRLAEPVAAEVARFDELVRTLRRDCPWDREQTHQSLARHLLEESYEVLDAVASLGPDGEGDELLEEELGDLLFQVVFHATLARERGAFGLADVATGIHDKLVARHPHVFGDTEATDSGQVLRNWEQLKQAEKGRASVMDGIPPALPALLYAEKVQRKAARSGFATPEGPADHVVVPVGEQLFELVALARRLDVDPEAALRAAAARYEAEFRQWEKERGEAE
jgi:tetrapyrrole methylase family protein/MazG family protein